MTTFLKIVLIGVLAFALNANAKTYATVNGKKITDEDVNVVLMQLNAKKGTTYKSLPKKDKKMVLDQAVATKLLLNNAVKSGITKSKEYTEALSRLKDDLAFRLWSEKEFKKVKVTNDEAKAFYKENKKKIVDPKTKKVLKYDKVKLDIIQNLRMMKFRQNLGAEAMKLKNNAKITYLK